jgi:hypothetical protein
MLDLNPTQSKSLRLAGDVQLSDRTDPGPGGILRKLA